MRCQPIMVPPNGVDFTASSTTGMVVKGFHIDGGRGGVSGAV
jgi:hypothetical protein